MSESEVLEPVAQPRTAAGVLLVNPTYKPGWEIPGGYLHPGETPSEGAARELKEELGAARRDGRTVYLEHGTNRT